MKTELLSEVTLVRSHVNMHLCQALFRLHAALKASKILPPPTLQFTTEERVFENMTKDVEGGQPQKLSFADYEKARKAPLEALGSPAEILASAQKSFSVCKKVRGPGGGGVASGLGGRYKT